MSETKYTPAPWFIATAIPRENKYYIHTYDTTSTTKRQMQVLVLDRGRHPIKEHSIRAEADAKLIAASPELLEALMKIVELSGVESWQSLHDIAKAAIEKATR